MPHWLDWLAFAWGFINDHWVLVSVIAGVLFGAGKIYMDGGVGR